jgi:hypothetical protein
MPRLRPILRSLAGFFHVLPRESASAVLERSLGLDLEPELCDLLRGLAVICERCLPLRQSYSS